MERKEKFTPGPWRTNNYYDQVITAYEPTSTRADGYGCHNNFVADLNDGEYHEYYDHEEQKANARLIAAAPDMRAYGEETVELMRRLVGMLPFGLDDEVKSQIAKWEEIAKKARGEE